MAAPQVHQKSGNCTQCGAEFSKQSMVLNIRYKDPKIPGVILRRKVCGKCYNEFYNKGE